MLCDEIAPDAYFQNKTLVKLEYAAKSHDVRNAADFTSVSEDLKT
jgi:hypothetical protein